MMVILNVLLLSLQTLALNFVLFSRKFHVNKYNISENVFVSLLQIPMKKITNEFWNSLA